MGNQKSVVITGGGKGIGADISRIFYKAGYRVFIGSRHDNGFADELGENAWFCKTDVRRPADLNALVDFAVNTAGALHVMINNAGYSGWRPLASIDEGFWNDMIDTNLKGTLFGCQAAVGQIVTDGCIINVSSLAGKRGSANNSVYCASKFGVNGVTQALAKEIGSRDIRVNAVCPVFVKTEGVIEALRENDSPAGGKDVHEFLENFTASQSALGRLPLGVEVGKACLFLASDAAGYVTGAVLCVDGGYMA